MHDDNGTTVHRITCAVRRQKSSEAIDLMSSLGINSVLMESGRTVRRRRCPRRFGLRGHVDRLDDSPIELFQFNLPPSISQTAMGQLVTALEINLPGHGTLYAQQVKEYIELAINPASELKLTANNMPRLIQDLALLTFIMSMNGSGEELAKLALELGTGVPMVTLGTGTGMRDRLGLLRITVPPQKELVHLLVPQLDAEGLMRLLIEKGRLNRPGKNFIYCSSVLQGFLDTSLQIGPQEHPASIEQMIAAIDELKANTAWRRRFSEIDDKIRLQLQQSYDEITLVCPEEESGDYVEAALQAGAGGATIARVRKLKMDGQTSGEPRERCIIIVPQNKSGKVVAAIIKNHKQSKIKLECLQIQRVPFSFSHRSYSSRQ